MINVYKEEGRTSLARPLGDCLAKVIATALEKDTRRSDWILIPIPSSRRAVRSRGHDPIRRLAKIAASLLGEASVLGEGASVATILRSQRRVADQAGLSAVRRAENLRGAFTVEHGLNGWPAILVDDVITTGATLAEAARALRATGMDVRLAATIAATQRR